MLNANATPANVSFTLFFNDCEPVGPLQVTIPARRVLHQNLLALPGATLPLGTDYCVLIESDEPIVSSTPVWIRARRRTR